MTDSELHDPEFDGTTTEKWEGPRLEDFETDDLSDVADHVILSVSGFPPENFTDRKLPVVDPDGNPNRNALERRKAVVAASAQSKSWTMEKLRKARS